MKGFLVSALLFLALPVHAQSEPVAGKDYIEIPNGRPLDAGPEGTVVVEEFFNYICPACNAFEPTFVTWTKQLPPYAKVHHVAASFRADFLPYARAYYAAEALGVAEKSHAAVYSAIHTSHSLPAEGDKPDEEKIAKFYARYGVDAQTFLATMRSFGVDSKVRRANEYMKRVRVTGTPAIVINGRYLVQGGSLKDTLRIASYLVEKAQQQH